MAQKPQPHQTLYTICIGFYDNRQSTVEQCAVSILLTPRDGEEQPPPGFGLFTYRWSCLLDASGKRQESSVSRFPRDARDSNLQAVIRLGELRNIEINRAIHTINGIVQEAVQKTRVEPRCADRCPQWLSYAMQVTESLSRANSLC